MKISIFSHQALRSEDNEAEIIQVNTNEDSLDETFDLLQQDGYQIDAWYGNREEDEDA